MSFADEHDDEQQFIVPDELFPKLDDEYDCEQEPSVIDFEALVGEIQRTVTEVFQPIKEELSDMRLKLAALLESKERQFAFISDVNAQLEAQETSDLPRMRQMVIERLAGGAK